MASVTKATTNQAKIFQQANSGKLFDIECDCNGNLLSVNSSDVTVINAAKTLGLA